jgi:hypothetical protein
VEQKETNMSTQLATTTDNAFLAYGASASARSFEGTLLRFNKGQFIAGKGDRIPDGARFIACMNGLQAGWTHWREGRPDDHKMVYVADGTPPATRAELGDQDSEMWEIDRDGKAKDPWQFANHLPLRDPDTGELYTFVTSSRGGLSAVGRLRIRQGNPDARCGQGAGDRT